MILYNDIVFYIPINPVRDDILKHREAIAKSETCSAWALQVERWLGMTRKCAHLRWLSLTYDWEPASDYPAFAELRYSKQTAPSRRIAAKRLVALLEGSE